MKERGASIVGRKWSVSTDKGKKDDWKWQQRQIEERGVI